MINRVVCVILDKTLLERILIMGNYRNFELVVYFIAHGVKNLDEDKLQKQIDFFKKYMRLDKVYIEPYRDGCYADEEQLRLCRDIFLRNGIKTEGGITTSMPDPEDSEKKQRIFNVMCYNDEVMMNTLKEVCKMNARVFDAFIIDDFFFTFEEFIKVRDILIEKGKLQSAVLWSLGFDSAGRRNELLQVEKHGLTENNKTNTVVGKRGKKFCLVYLDDTKELIKQYLEERGEDDIDSLWYKNLNGKREPVTADALYDRICSISNILSEVRGEKCNIFPHTMRHSRLECLAQGTDTRLVDENGNPKKFPLEQVQVFAHHSGIETTQSYLKNHDDDTINAMFGFEV